MLKHLLWFSRHPADEREAAILSVAYQRALTATWAGLVAFLFLVSPFSVGFRSVILAHAVLFLELVLVASILAGWTAVRSESLEFKPVVHEGRLAFRKLVIIWVAATFAGMVPVWLSPGLEYGAIFAVFVAFVVAAMAWSWNWTRSYTFHGRMLATVLLPFQTIGFLLEPKASMARRLFLSTILTIGAVGVPLALWVPVVRLVAEPSGFSGPIVPGLVTPGDATGGSFHHDVLDYRLLGGLHEGDVVMFGNRKPFADDTDYGVIVHADGRTVTVDVQDAFGQSTDGAYPDVITIVNQHHTKDVPRDQVFAKVIIDPPMSGWPFRQ